MVLEFEPASESPRGLIKMQISGPHLQSLKFSGSGRVDKILFPTCFQLMIMLLETIPLKQSAQVKILQSIRELHQISNLLKVENGLAVI